MMWIGRTAACAMLATTAMMTGAASEELCSPRAPGAKILRSANIAAIHPDWKPPSMIGDSWNLVGVRRLQSGFLSGCLVSPRAALDHDGSCPQRERVFVVLKEWACRR